jgi:probable HAF family extracellular repeat protein
MNSRAARGLALGFALTLAHCANEGPTQPSGPFRLTVLQAFGTSSSPFYDGLSYQSYAYAINPSSQVVGMAELAQPRDFYHGALWASDSQPPISLDTNGSVLQVAYGINALGQVVGVGLCGGRGVACIWDAGHLSNLGSLDYDGQSEPLAINNQGDVAGWADAPPDGFDHAVLWRAGVATDLGTLGGVQSEALAIDDSGRVVGWARVGGAQPGPRHAFLWQNGVMNDLDTLLAGEESIAYAINDSGQVVGRLGDIGGRAVLWKKGAMSLLPGAESSQAFGLNNRGDIVGTYIPFGTTFHAALWRDGVRYDLDELVGDPQVTLSWANAINDAGQIVGRAAWRSTGREIGFLLTPNVSR